MTLSHLMYGLVLGGFLTGAAALSGRTLRTLGAPTRWVWGLALAATTGLPLLFLLWQPAVVPTRSGFSIPSEVLAEALAALPSTEGPGTGWSFPLTTILATV